MTRIPSKGIHVSRNLKIIQNRTNARLKKRKKGKTRPNKESLGCSLVDIKVEKQHAHRSRMVKMLAPKKRLVRKRFTPQSPFAERLLFVMTGIEEFCLLFFC